MHDAAARLLRVLDERSKKRKNSAGGGLGAGTNSDQQRWSPTAEKCGSPELKRSAMLDGLPQSTHAEGGHCGDHAPQGGENGRGLGMGGGQTDFQFVRFSYGSKGAVRPSSGSSPMLAERARHAPEDEID